MTKTAACLYIPWVMTVCALVLPSCKKEGSTAQEPSKSAERKDAKEFRKKASAIGVGRTYQEVVTALGKPDEESGVTDKAGTKKSLRSVTYIVQSHPDRTKSECLFMTFALEGRLINIYADNWQWNESVQKRSRASTPASLQTGERNDTTAFRKRVTEIGIGFTYDEVVQLLGSPDTDTGPTRREDTGKRGRVIEYHLSPDIPEYLQMNFTPDGWLYLILANSWQRVD